MQSLTNFAKLGAALGLFTLGPTAFSAARADAASHASRCDSYGCYRVRCHDDGFGCVRTSTYYSSDYTMPRNDDRDMDAPYYHATARWLCNSDGENCYWTHTYRDAYDFY